MTRPALFALAMALAAPAIAQTQTQPPPTAQPDGAGLEVTVSDENDWQDLGVAITVFATDQDVPTQTNAGSTAALGRSVSQVIAADLRNNGLFKPSGPDGLPQPSYPPIDPRFPRVVGAQCRNVGAGLCPRRGGRAVDRGLLSL